MQIIIEKIKKVKLELSEEEAIWLKDQMQNPISYNSDDEPTLDMDMRQRFWNALDSANIK